MKTKQSFLRQLILGAFLIMAVPLQQLQAQITVSGSNSNGSYTTLTNASGAFAALNSVSQAGKIITITITADVTTEAGTNALTGAAGLWTSLTISPSGARTISGSATKPIIDLSGADYVSIDGLNTGGNTLTILNSSTSTLSGTSTIRFINDATYNNIKNCTIKGCSGSGLSPNYAATILFNSPTSTGNNNNIIEYNNITNAGGVRPVYSSIFSTGANSLNTIRYNNFYDLMAPGANSYAVSLGGTNFSWTIQGNSFYETTASPGFVTTANNVSYTAINILGGYGYTVSGNYIGGNAPNCVGTWYKAGDFDNSFLGIYVKAIAGIANNIQGNTIKGFNWSNTNASNTYSTYFTAIQASGNPASTYGDFNIGDVTGNTIGAATGNGSIIFTANYMGGTPGTTSAFYGIYVTYGGVTVIKNNIIGAITTANATAANGVHIYGIMCEWHGISATTIQNNTIGSTDAGTTNSMYASSGASGSTSSQQIWGIRSDVNGPVTITGNTISKLTNGSTNTVTSTSYASYNIGILTTSGTNTISNNTIQNLTNGSSTIDASYYQNSVVGIVQYSSVIAAQTVTGNTIYNLSNSNASFAGSVIGLWYNGSTTLSTIGSNFITGLSINPAGSAASIYGIKTGSASAVTLVNNIISLGGTVAAPLYGTNYGIYEGAGSGYTAKLYFNTVYIGGTPTSGASINSYALYSSALHTRDFRNNNFYNARANGGTATGKHYAVYFVTNPSATGLTQDYNNYYAPGIGGVFGRYNGADVVSLAAWKTATTMDAYSANVNPLFNNVGGSAASDYSISAGLVGVSGTGVTIDYSGATRWAVPRMGAWEINSVLPLELISFTGTATDNANKIQWTTANEINSSYFELLRSSSTTNFNSIVRINNLGNIGTRETYNYLDKMPIPGRNFYRLKIVDADGSISYSSIISITTGKGNQQLAVYPNPVTNGVLNLQLPNTAVLEIFNSMGVLVHSNSLKAGMHQLAISHLAKGIYFIRANNEKLKIINE